MYGTIVVGTDGSETASAAVIEATRLAKLCGATVHIVCAYKTTSAMASMAVETSAYVNPEDMRRGAEGVLERAAAQVRQEDVKVETHAAAGSAPEALIEIAEAQGGNLIVIGSRGMTGARRLLGSVPNNVAHHAPCSVLIVQTG
jgi:nucleotide-binding universal stress UspA family protein